VSRPSSNRDVPGTLIGFADVALGYRRHAVLSGLTFAVHDNEFFGIVGANGSGKTTILRAMLGILAPLRGRIRYAGGATRRRFGYVPQRAFVDELFPLTALDIVLMGRYGLLPAGRRPGERDRRIAQEQLAHVGIGDLAARRFRDLSGGQKQRVLFARALASEPRVLLMDEPTDGMDLAGQQAILDLITRLRSETGITIVYVTHRLNELANFADRLLLLHDDRLRVGTVGELLTPAVLHEMYGVDAHVAHVAGRRVIVT
jgi:ABC-type Mn2+/Zn2+ transport system ATPase subunit